MTVIEISVSDVNAAAEKILAALRTDHSTSAIHHKYNSAYDFALIEGARTSLGLGGITHNIRVQITLSTNTCTIAVSAPFDITGLKKIYRAIVETAINSVNAPVQA